MRFILALFFVSATSSFAAPFSPVLSHQVPSGMEYHVDQPRVENPSLLAGKKVAILASHGVEETEIKFPYEFLKARGAEVEILVPGWTPQGVVAVRFLQPSLFVAADGTFREGLKRNYDLVVLTGGAWNAQVVRTDQEALSLVRAQANSGKPLAAICAGTTVLIDAGLANGLTMTTTPTAVMDVKNAGARYLNQALVRDGKIATSRSPEDSAAFSAGLQALLLGP